MNNSIDVNRYNVFDELNKYQGRYAVIRNSSSGGDIDIIVDDIEKFKCFLLKNQYVLFENNDTSLKFIKFSNDFRWLLIDITISFDLSFFSIANSSLRLLLEERYFDVYNIPKIKLEEEFLINLLHVYKFKQSDLDRFFKYNNYENVIINKNNSIIYNMLMDVLNVSNIPTLNIGNIENIFKSMRAIFKYKVVKPSLLSRIKSRVSKFFTRDAIVFMGPDGSGKSSLTEIFSSLQWPKIKIQYMGPLRIECINPILRPLLLFFVDLRSRSSKISILGILSRFFCAIFTYIDFIERYIKNKYFVGSGGIVIYDRYPYDMYFRNPTLINKIIYINLFIKPKFIFLCGGDGFKINQRKPELSPDAINNTTELYKKIFSKNKDNYVFIDTVSNDINKTVSLILPLLIEQTKR